MVFLKIHILFQAEDTLTECHFLDSEFSDIFDVNYFIESLREDVRIVEALPAEFAKITPVSKAPVSWSKVC